MTKNRLTTRGVLLALCIGVSTISMADREVTRRLGKDSLTISSPSWSEVPEGKMAHSAYPVKLMVKGHSLRVISKHEQTLPIYTQGGSLYLAMQLTPGTNWLNGLPRGRYRINNRTIRIK